MCKRSRTVLNGNERETRAGRTNGRCKDSEEAVKPRGSKGPMDERRTDDERKERRGGRGRKGPEARARRNEGGKGQREEEVEGGEEGESN